jgi:hypothetical protein
MAENKSKMAENENKRSIPASLIIPKVYFSTITKMQRY